MPPIFSGAAAEPPALPETAEPEAVEPAGVEPAGAEVVPPQATRLTAMAAASAALKNLFITFPSCFTYLPEPRVVL